MIASLPMYDMPSVQAANDCWWQAIREALGRGPRHLTRDRSPFEHWTDPSLVLSQTCGFPYRTKLHGRVQLVCTPDYGVDGCAPGYYRSCVVVRDTDPRISLTDFLSGTIARNDAMSQSGWAALTEAMRAAGLAQRGRVIDTGSHHASINAVAGGEADFAAIDAVTWSLLERDTADTQGLRVLQVTEPTPGLPLITSHTEDPAALRDAVQSGLDALRRADRDRLRIKGLVYIPASDYLRVPQPAPAHRA